MVLEQCLDTMCICNQLGIFDVCLADSEKRQYRNANDLYNQSPHLPVTADHVQQTVDEVFVPQLLELKAVASEVAEQLAVEHNADLFGFFISILLPLDKLPAGQRSRLCLSTPSKVLTQ